MADETLYVIDRIVTKPGCGRQFVDALLDQYLPSAQRRGMTLAEVLVSPPLWCDQDPNTLTVTWTVDGTAGWWSMTRQGRRDSTLRQWGCNGSAHNRTESLHGRRSKGHRRTEQCIT